MFVNSQESSKIRATRWQIFRLKCTKFAFRWGSASDPAGEAYSAPPDPLGEAKVKKREMERRARDLALAGPPKKFGVAHPYVLLCCAVRPISRRFDTVARPIPPLYAVRSAFLAIAILLVVIYSVRQKISPPAVFCKYLNNE